MGVKYQREEVHVKQNKSLLLSAPKIKSNKEVFGNILRPVCQTRENTANIRHEKEKVVT